MSGLQDAQRLSQALVELSNVQLELDRERLLRIEVEALFDDVLDAMTDAVVVTDPAGRVRRQNRAALAMLGPNPTAAHASAAGSSEPGAIFETAWEILRHSPDGSHTREVTITTPQHSDGYSATAWALIRAYSSGVRNIERGSAPGELRA